MDSNQGLAEHFSNSVRHAADLLSDEGTVTAGAFSKAILKQHSEYGGGKGGSLTFPTGGDTKLVVEWEQLVADRYDLEKVSRTDDKVIGGRLFLLGLADADPDLNVALKENGFLEELRKELHVAESELLAPSGDAAMVPGYASDLGFGTDRLGIKRDVETLCSVIASNQIDPPLAIGLFGDWGSGKTFFMNQMRKQVRVLSKAAQAKRGRSYYCSEIRQISFNAWHYADANLWASLVSQIFEKLDAPEPVDKAHADELAAMMQEKEGTKIYARLASAKRLARDLAAQKDARDKANKDLEDLDREGVVAALKLVDSPAGQAAQNDLAKITGEFGLGSDPTLSDLKGFAREIHGTWNQIKKIWKFGGSRKFLWVILLLIATLAVVAMLLEQGVIDWKLPTTTLASLFGGVLSLRGPFNQLKAVIDRTANVVDEMQKHDAKERATLAARQRKANEEINRLEGELKDLRPSRQLQRLIQERAAGDRYGKHLGIVSMVRQDFQEMTDLLRRTRAERAEESVVSGERDPAEKAKEGEKLPQIERIILYIDDLDRCPADRVVEVLEAVHMLLAFELFVVVVAVDPRWLRRSLRKHYSILLTVTEDDGSDPYGAAHWASTPMNYLEKIFQIPFTLHPMTTTGYERLIKDLLPVEADQVEALTPRVATATEKAKRAQQQLDQLLRVSAVSKLPMDGALMKAHGEVRDTNRTLNKVELDVAVSEVDVVPDALMINPGERSFIAGLGPLIRTPRAAKRLANVYRLLKVTLEKEESRSFEREYGAALLLLAFLVGYPNLSNPIFRRILSGRNDEDWSVLVQGFRPTQLVDAQGKPMPKYNNAAMEEMNAATAAAWFTFSDNLAMVQTTLPVKLGPFRKWARRVARYSFHTGRLVEAH